MSAAIRLISKLMSAVPQSAHRGKRPQKVRKDCYDYLFKTSEPTKRLRGIAKAYMYFRQVRAWRELGETIARDIHMQSERKGFARRFIEDKKECENA